MAQLPELQQRAGWFVRHRPHLVSNIHDPRRPGFRDRRMLSLLSEDRLRRVLARMLDENEFLSPFGIRSLSRYHLDHPYAFDARRRTPERRLPAGRVGHRDVRRQLELARPGLAARQRPAHPRAAQLLRLLRPDLQGRVPDRIGPPHDPVRGRAQDLRAPGAASSAPINAGAARCSAARRKFSDDPLWRDHLLFYEYFHGDNGAGIGASHQTGWTGLDRAAAALLRHRAARAGAGDVVAASAAGRTTKASARLRKTGGRTLAVMLAGP